MNIRNLTERVSKGFYSITEVAAWIGAIVTACIALIVFVDVCGRYFLNKPLTGAFEIVEQGMAVLAGFAIMYAAVKRGHVALDLIVRRFSRCTQMIMGSIFSLLGFGISVVLAYQVYLSAFSEIKNGLRTSTLQLSTAPFTFMLAVALFLCSLTLLMLTFYPVASEEASEVKE